MVAWRTGRRLLLVAVLAIAPAVATSQEVVPYAGPWPPPGGRLVLEDFEWCPLDQLPLFWSEHPTQPAGQVRVDRCGEAGEARFGLALEGTVPAPPDDPMLIEAARGLAIPALAERVVLTAQGDANGCQLHVRLQDVEDETYGFVFTDIKADEWTDLPVPLDEAASRYHFGGDNDGAMEWPLRLQSVGVARTHEAQAGDAFRLLIDEIACDLPETDAIPIEIPELERGGAEPPWQLEGRNLGGTRLEMAADEAYPDSVCTWLNFAWGGGDERSNSFAELLRDTPLDGAAGTIFAWIKGDGSGNLCTFRFRDATGEVLQFHRFTTTTHWKNWRCVFLDTYLDRRLYWIDHWDGNNNGLIDGPLTFQSIVIDDIAPAEAGDQFHLSAARGRIGIGSVWFVPWTER